MNSNIILTASLISSGRGATIERALKSLMPLKEQLGAKISVIDTDEKHDENVRKILEKYADEITEFKWCNDFSAARNAQLATAEGEWFFYIDDDEWLFDAASIIDFIKSGESKAYSGANLSVRSYAQSDLSRYSDMWANRLIRLTEKTHFKGAIHEYVDPPVDNAAGLSAIIGHTGYIYENEEQKQAHSNRNITLLEQCLKDEPDNWHWRLQLLIEYAHIDDFDMQRRLCDEAIEGLRTENNTLCGVFMAARIRIEQRLSSWDDAKRLIEDFTGYDGLTETARAYISYEACTVYFNLMDYEKGEKYALSYLDSYDRLHGKEHTYSNELLYILQETFGDNVFSIVFSLGVNMQALRGEFGVFKRYSHKLSWDESTPFDWRGYEGTILSVMADTGYYPEYADIVEVFWSNEITREVVNMALSGMTVSEGGGRWNLVRAVVEADKGGDIPWQIHMLWAIHADIDMSDMLVEIKFNQIRRSANLLYESGDIETLRAVLAYIKKWLSKADMRKRYISYKASLGILYRWNDPLNAYVGEGAMLALQRMESEMRAFVTDCLTFYDALYKENCFKTKSAALPKDARFAITLQRLLTMPRDDYRAILGYVRDEMGSGADYDVILQTYSHLYADALKEGI